MRLFLILFLTVSVKLSYCQQPSHFILGEKELEGVEIYGLLQSFDYTYWIASDHGLFSYDGYEFKKYDCPERLGRSVFNLTEDIYGNIYCNNLNGQIFQIKESVFQVFYTTPKAHLTPNIKLAADHYGHLLIATNGIVLIRISDKIVQVLDQLSAVTVSDFFVRKDSSIVIYSGDKKLYKIVDGQLVNRIDIGIPDSVMTECMEIGKELFLFSIGDGSIYRLNEQSGEAILVSKLDIGMRSIVFPEMTGQSVWIRGLVPGVERLDAHLLQTGQKLFADFYISKVYEDIEGNILLGTFNDGIIVIPTNSLYDCQLPEMINFVSRIEASSSGDIFLGTRKGKILRIDQEGNVVPLLDEVSKNVETLFYLEKENVLVSEMGFVQMSESIDSILSIHQQTAGAIKDIKEIKNGQFLMASNVGCYYSDSYKVVDLETHVEPSEILPVDKNINLISSLSKRSYAIEYDYISKSIFASTVEGVKVINEFGDSHELKMNGKRLMANDLLFHKGRIIVSTEKNGILFFKKNKLVKEWNTSKGLISNSISQLQLHDDKFYVASSQGLQVLNSEGEEVYLLDTSNGLHSDNIIDFCIARNKIWLVLNKRLQYIDLDKLRKTPFSPSIKFKSVQMNDSTVSLEASPFSYDRNNISFELHSSSIKHNSKIMFNYQLEGADLEETLSSQDENIINYKSLAPGTYLFRAKSVWHEEESEEISYAFTICEPFWKTWWFITSLTIFILSSTILFFWRRFQLIQQRIRQQNELNTARLTAIKSQMNPHFIFNALNSIQDLVLKEKTEDSYNQITKFGSLIRATLDYSEKEYIDFEDELKLLETYLSMEKLRFKENFFYIIDKGDVQNIRIPPMLIQPFLENALLHGLLHKEGNKKLSIKFGIEEKVLICLIKDNGIGRKTAQVIRERQQQKHESFAINAIKRRLEILSQQTNTELGIDYTDLTDKNEDSGTLVKLRIPYIRNF